jgi:hypothetical protein
MTTTDTIAVLALVVAVAATVAAFGSWMAAVHSNRTSAAMARIEQQRLHTELTPDLRCAVEANADRTNAMLFLHIDGPPGLQAHGPLEYTVSIRNDSPWRGSAPQLAGGPDPQQVRAHVWGPWRFRADGCDENGRTVATQQLALGDWTQYGLAPTMPPQWWTLGTERWRGDYENAPVRLTITARSAAGETWTVQLEVPVSAPDTP